MSGTTPPTITPAARYALGGAVRSTVVPRALVGLLVLFALLLIGFLVNGFVYRFLNNDALYRDTAPVNQTTVAAPPPFAYPPDTTAPTREAFAAAPPPQPRTTAAQDAVHAVTDAVGGGSISPARPVMMEASKGWHDIDKATLAARPGSPSQTPMSEADQAAVAFGAKPRAPDLEGSKATAVADLTRTIRPGTRVFCTSQQAIDTTTGAGAFVCDVDRWVQAWDGMTPLIPPHSWITVRYEELKNGRNRIFAASGLLTTPDGVVVSLGDPFTMPDGSGGVEGVVEDKTWARLREGLILDFAQSAFQALGQVLANSNSNGNSNNNNLNLNLSTNNTQQAVNGILEKNAAIPDVLRLAQGAHLGMIIMHPVMMQNVVGFTMRAGR